MLKKMINMAQSRRRIWFNLKRSHLCPLCNNELYYDTKEKIYKCKNEQCAYTEEKVDFLLDESNTLIDDNLITE